MGTWGVEPWQSDAAADWFTELFKSINFDEQIRVAFKYCDNYGEIRAACHLLAGLGQVGVWPGDLKTLQEFLSKGIELLTNMVEPKDDEKKTDFLELWDNDPEVVLAIQQQIMLLQKRLNEFGNDSIAGIRAQVFGNSMNPDNDDQE